MKRRTISAVVLAVAVGAVLGAGTSASTATVQTTRNWPPPACPAGLLVAYYVSDGFTFNDDLVIGADGQGWLCWGRHIRSTSGEETFTVSQSKLATLESALGRIGTQRLGASRRQPCCDMPTASLVYNGKTIPYDGYPRSQAGVLALRSAEAILNAIVEQRSPDHQSVRVIEPLTEGAD
jgi:hypothetical protein